MVSVGDSPDDAPLSGFFRHACGVSGVRNLTRALEAEPACFTGGGGGRGLVEVTDRLPGATRTRPARET